jgi:hypothetical protein
MDFAGYPQHDEDVQLVALGPKQQKWQQQQIQQQQHQELDPPTRSAAARPHRLSSQGEMNSNEPLDRFLTLMLLRAVPRKHGRGTAQRDRRGEGRHSQIALLAAAAQGRRTTDAQSGIDRLGRRSGHSRAKGQGNERRHRPRSLDDNTDNDF